MKTRKASEVIRKILDKLKEEVENKAAEKYPLPLYKGNDELVNAHFEDTADLLRNAYIDGYKEGFRVGGNKMLDWIEENNKDIEDIMSLISDYGQIDGAHHKAWVLDQIVRIITKDKYEAFVKSYCGGEDGPDTYTYDAGVAP